MKARRHSKTSRLEVFIPAALAGEGEPRPFLARGDTERRSFPGGLPAGSRRRGCLRGGVVDVLFTAFLGEWDLEELLPEVEAERERLLGHSSGRVSIVHSHERRLRRLWLISDAVVAYRRTGERLCLCRELCGPRLGGLLRRGDILLLGLGLLRGE